MVCGQRVQKRAAKRVKHPFLTKKAAQKGNNLIITSPAPFLVLELVSKLNRVLHVTLFLVVVFGATHISCHRVTRVWQVESLTGSVCHTWPFLLFGTNLKSRQSSVWHFSVTYCIFCAMLQPSVAGGHKTLLHFSRSVVPPTDYWVPQYAFRWSESNRKSFSVTWHYLRSDTYKHNSLIKKQ